MPEVQLNWHLLIFSHMHVVHTCTHTQTHIILLYPKYTSLTQSNHITQALFFPKGDNWKIYPAYLVRDDIKRVSHGTKCPQIPSSYSKILETFPILYSKKKEKKYIFFSLLKVE